MLQAGYAKEPFDLKLFVLRCMSKLQWIILCAAMGALIIGGIYYVKNVTFGGRIPYVITQKLDVDYAKDPDTGSDYSYYVAYTWEDWIKSDVFMEGFLEKLPEQMTKEEVSGYYEMTLPADVRHPYLTVKHPDRDMASALADALRNRLFRFAEEQKEIDTIDVIDTTGPAPEIRDIRTLRAVILGAVLGTFFALFATAFQMVLEEGIFLPETFTYRYQVPVIGYIDENGTCSAEVSAAAAYLFRDKQRIGITAVEPELDLTEGKSLFGEEQAVCVPSVLQVPEAFAYLRECDANLLLVSAGIGNGKAIESVLYMCKMHDVEITAVLLVGADSRLIRRYRLNLSGKKGGGAA